MPLDSKDIERLRKDPYKEESLQLLNCLVKQNEDLITLLSDLNDKKQQQLDNDVGFREVWEELKKSDKKTAYLTVILATTALYFEVIKVEDFVEIKERLFAVAQPLLSMLGA